MSAGVVLDLFPDSAALEPGLLEAARLHAEGKLIEAAKSYKQLLEVSPGAEPALLGLSLLARQTGQFEPALALARAVVAANAESAPAWTQLAHALFAAGQFESAESAYRRAIKLAPDRPLAWVSLGEFLAVTQRPGLASQCFRLALKIDSRFAPAHYGLGNTFALGGDFETALTWFERALELNPKHPESHFAVAFCRARLGRTAEAVAGYREAVSLRPNFAGAWLNLGVALIADGRDQLAELCYLQALAANPKLISAHLNLGNLARSRRHFAQARVHYERALALNSEASEIHVAFGYLYLEQQQFGAAWRSLRVADEINSRDPEIANARGILRLAETAVDGSHAGVEAAIVDFEEAEALGHKTAASNRGNALLRLGRVEEALAAHEEAVARDVHHAGARYNLALTQLRVGNFARGWANYEVRWLFREVHQRPRRFAQSRWIGEPARGVGERLLIYAEQGLGDTIQFVRYLPRVARMGFSIVLEAQPPLVRLLEPLAAALGAEVVAFGCVLPDFDWHCPLLSLPAIFQATLKAVPGDTPYLGADPELAIARRKELQDWGENRDGLRIGLAWAGNPKYRADKERSTEIRTFLALLEMPGIQWISLQKGEAAAQMAGLPAHIRLCDGSSRERDLADTAALVANLDLVISTDTVIAHLAGAMGKPLWLLLPWQSDWRWMQETAATPWYPQARLFRQSAPGDWEELVSRVRTALMQANAAGRLEFPAAGARTNSL